MADVSSLGYRELAIRYDLGSLKEGGDLSLTPDGDLATTVDGDLKIENDQHNALHRLVVRWQMEAPLLSSLFSDVLGTEEKKRKYEAMIDALLSRPALDQETVDQFHELQHAIGINKAGPGNGAGAIAVALYNMLRREWVDLGRPATWGTAGQSIYGRSFGRVMEAAASNFRHGDEWARTEPPTKQQLESIQTIADVFGATLSPNGSRHPYRGNICPKLIQVVSGGAFDGLADRFFDFARALAGL